MSVQCIENSYWEVELYWPPTHLLIIRFKVDVAVSVFHSILVYVVAWVAIVFGINFASNVGRKLVIVQGAAELY